MPASSLSSTRDVTSEKRDDAHGDDGPAIVESKSDTKGKEKTFSLSERQSQALLANWETVGYAAFQLARALGGYFSDKIVGLSCTLWQELSSDEKIASTAQRFASVCFDAIEKEMKEEKRSQRPDSGEVKTEVKETPDSKDTEDVD